VNEIAYERRRFVGLVGVLRGGTNAEFFAKATEKPSELIVLTVNLSEVFKRVLQQRSDGDALQAVAVMQQGRIVELSGALALAAARLSVHLGMPMADSIMLATARTWGATLWTQDSDFDGVPGVRYVAKQKSRKAG
jgi:predicted nucleic acid-binding protein